MKYNEQIETLSLIIGAVTHLFEYSSGKINVAKQNLKSVIISLKSKSFKPGLEFDFGELVFQSIITLINTDKVETELANKNDNNYDNKKIA